MLVVDRLENDAVSAFANLLEQLETLSAGFLLAIELLLGLSRFARLPCSFAGFSGIGVAVTLRVGVLATVDHPGRGLSSQADVFVKFAFDLGLRVHG